MHDTHVHVDVPPTVLQEHLTPNVKQLTAVRLWNHTSSSATRPVTTAGTTAGRVATHAAAVAGGPARCLLKEERFEHPINAGEGQCW